MRVFDAPRLLVFKVWTEPKHVAQWCLDTYVAKAFKGEKS
jgi:uncharacterized protein YndB with AHSA1/START domain